MSAPSSAPSGWTLAIDFGTSNTVVVVKDQRGINAVEFAGHRWFPSVVFADDNGGLISGLEAFNNRLVQPRRYFAEVKQTVTSRSPTVYVAGQPYATVDAVAAVLGEAKRSAMAFRGDPTDLPARTALTHPVAWEDDQIDVLQQAAEKAGLPNVTTFQEPVAAAFHLYHNGFQPGEHIAVYDLGGGTFDAAILERDVTREPEPGQVIRPPFRVIATVGNPKIGGEKFDDELWDLLGSGDLRGAPAWAALQDESRPDPTTDEPSFLDWLVGRRRLRQAIIDLKIDLSTRDQAAVYVPNIALPQTITRTQLEEVLLPYLSSTVDLLLKLIERNELAHSDIVHVALVGGSSQIPLVRRLLAERGRFDYARVSAPGSAQAVVALGAAALAETKKPETEAERAFNAAQSMDATGGWRQAKSAYQQAIECRDSEWSPRAAYQLGQLRTRHPDRKLLGKSYDSAIAAYTTAMAHEGTEWAAKSGLALAKLYLTTKRLDDAAVVLDNVVGAHQPDVSPEAAFNLGLLHVRRGDWRSAEDAWRTTIDHKHPYWAPRAAYELGAQRRMRRNYVGAKHAWQVAMDDFTHPDWSPRAACELGGLLSEKGRKTWQFSKAEHEKAIESSYQTAIDYGHPEWSPRAAYELGAIRQKRRNWRGAADAYQVAIASGTSRWATSAMQRKAEIRKYI